MKAWTRILSLLMSLLMLASFVACTEIDMDEDETTTEAGTDATTEPDTTAPETESDTAPDAPAGDSWDKYDIITIAEALELCGEPGNLTEERYYIRGTIDTIHNAMFGEMTISDETGSIYVYGTYGDDGDRTFDQLQERPVKGDEVLLYCTLQNFNGTKEVKNAWLIDFRKVEVEINPDEYVAATIAEARDAEKGTKLKISGVVARITYANGMKPSGFMLVDDTASIYVYDGDAAQQVAIGNKVEIAGSKAYWILESEQSSASKFGYKGCNQLDSVTLLSNDKGNHEFSKASVEETTVRSIMLTPVSEDITSKIYKVTAVVNKVEGKGFVNYYINDLDNETGSYSYSQCNGGDFAWLDEFDGKICTVYLVALNAKSQQAGCNWRFLPVAVMDEGYVFDAENEAAPFVMEYYAANQFGLVYTGDPMLEMITSVSSELLGFENATVTYEFSNENVISFAEEGDKLVMHCVGVGKATVKVTTAYGNTTCWSEFEIEVAPAAEVDAVDVKTAIGAPLGEIVTVKGIVGPSLVNKTGFYLIDETGMIAVQMTAEMLSTVEMGQMVVLQGTREVKADSSKGGGDAYFGQSNLYNCTVVANYYGRHEYDASAFTTACTAAEFFALDAKIDYSTRVFVFKATVEVVDAAYFSNINLVDGSTSIGLYCSSASQYNWLKEFAGQEVTVEVAACNWNDKKFWRGCVMSVITEDGKVYNTLNFDV